MPNGAKPFGRSGSTNAPGLLTGFQLPSKTSTFPGPAKSVAYKRGPDGPFEIASPLKLASGMITVGSAAVDGPRHALMIPSSPSKMKFEVPSAVGDWVVPTWNWPEIPEK